MYIRFVVGNDNEDHRKLTGVITEARMLIEKGELESYEIQYLEEIFDWLSENLPCPPFSENPDLQKGACWFKSTAREAIEKIREIVALLEGHDIPVRMLRSNMPGKCLYSDEYQILVEERKWI